jgi:hypothetical protein
VSDGECLWWANRRGLRRSPTCRLFACDWYASVPRRQMGDRQGANVSIGICLASEQMIRDVESVMLRLGIVGSVRTKPSRYDKSGRVFPAWTWTVSRVEDMKRFQDLVGILGKTTA